jgi:hypothetical protein
MSARLTGKCFLIPEISHKWLTAIKQRATQHRVEKALPTANCRHELTAFIFGQRARALHNDPISGDNPGRFCCRVGNVGRSSLAK